MVKKYQKFQKVARIGPKSLKLGHKSQKWHNLDIPLDLVQLAIGY